MECCLGIKIDGTRCTKNGIMNGYRHVHDITHDNSQKGKSSFYSSHNDKCPANTWNGVDCPYNKLRFSNYCVKHTSKDDMLKVAQYYAEEQGGKCLSIEYINTQQKLMWQCAEGFTWEATLSKVKDVGRWCPHCAKQVKLSIETAHEEAAKHGGKCLSQHYINIGSKLIWQCKEGFIWEATLNDIRNSKQWCPHCYGNAKLSIEIAQQEADKHGGKCLSTEYIHKDAELEWKCLSNHIFKTSLNNVRNRSIWCPQCNESSLESQSRFIFEQILNITFTKIRPEWLRDPNTSYNLELDGYCDKYKVAFEAQGKQHYEYVEYFCRGNEDIFTQRLIKDQFKRDRCKEQGVLLIEVPCNEYRKDGQGNVIELRQYISDQIIKNNIHFRKFNIMILKPKPHSIKL